MDTSIGEELEAAPVEPLAAEALQLADVFDAHAAYVGRSLRCLGVREREVADTIQEVFLVVHRRLPELRNPGALRSWLYAICVRKAMALRRKAARRREHPVPELPQTTDDQTPHDELVRTRALAHAIQILADLDEDKRAVFVLYEVEQLPMSEVAAAIDVPLQTAYSRLYSARREIQRSLLRMKARGEVER